MTRLWAKLAAVGQGSTQQLQKPAIVGDLRVRILAHPREEEAYEAFRRDFWLFAQTLQLSDYGSRQAAPQSGRFSDRDLRGLPGLRSGISL
jgi:hypothetical protein